MQQVKVIIAGGRDFDDYKLMKHNLDFYLKNDDLEIIIISGGARGADQLGERYAKENGLQVIRKDANWDEYGKRAGFIRNEVMAGIGDALIAFWDGKSKGTKHMISCMRKRRKPVRIIWYKQNK